MKTLAVVTLSVVTTLGLPEARSRPPDGPATTQVCGKEDPGARADVIALLRDEDKSDARAQVGLADVDLRGLSRVTDAPTCARLFGQLERTYQVQGETSPYVATFYHVADRFIAHVIPREAVQAKPAPAGSVAITDVKVVMVVFDDAFEKLRTFLM